MADDSFASDGLSSSSSDSVRDPSEGPGTDSEAGRTPPLSGDSPEPSRQVSPPTPDPGPAPGADKLTSQRPVRPSGRRTLELPSPPPPGSRSRLESWPLAFLILGLVIIGSCHFTVMSFFDSVGKKMEASSLGSARQPSVGVLVMEGEIASSLWAVKTLNQYQDDPNILAVVLRLDTPGGAVAPCQEIVETLRSMTKPVVISMGSMAASGGLYLAMAGDHIMANPGTITGSIGVIMETVQISGTLDKLGVKAEVIKSGQFKDIGSPFRDMRTEERDMIQSMVMEVYEQFVGEVIKGRPNLKEQEIRRLADGRLFNGQQALKAGLIDELGSLDKAVQKAITLAKGRYDPQEDIPVIFEDGRGTLLDRLIGSTQTFLKPSSLLSQGGMKFLYRPGL